MEKLRGFADHESAEIVAQIASEEVGHVAVGVKWFRYICDKQRVDAKVYRLCTGDKCFPCLLVFHISRLGPRSRQSIR